MNKSELATIRELNGLILRGMIHVHTVQFNARPVRFYTLRDDVRLHVVQTPGRPGRWEI